MYTDLSAFNSQNFFFINSDLIKALNSLEEAALFSKILNLSTAPLQLAYRKEHNDSFFITLDKIEEDLCLKESKQRSLFNSLEAKGLVELHNEGTPPRRHIKIISEGVLRCVNEYLKACEVKQRTPAAPEVTKEEYYNNLTNSVFKGFDYFKKEIKSMDKNCALPLYVWTRALYLNQGIKVKWNTASYGKFKHAIKPYSQSMDYRRLIATTESDEYKTSSNLIWTFININRATPSNASCNRVSDPTTLDIWENIK